MEINLSFDVQEKDFYYPKLLEELKETLNKRKVIEQEPFKNFFFHLWKPPHSFSSFNKEQTSKSVFPSGKYIRYKNKSFLYHLDKYFVVPEYNLLVRYEKEWISFNTWTVELIMKNLHKVKDWTLFVFDYNSFVKESLEYYKYYKEDLMFLLNNPTRYAPASIIKSKIRTQYKYRYATYGQITVSIEETSFILYHSLVNGYYFVPAIQLLYDSSVFPVEDIEFFLVEAGRIKALRKNFHSNGYFCLGNHPVAPSTISILNQINLNSSFGSYPTVIPCLTKGFQLQILEKIEQKKKKEGKANG